MPYLITDDQRQIYFEHHLGQGAQRRLPVLLLHGWGMSTRVWDTTVPALLAAGHSVVAFDQRGCGQSDKDFRENTIAASARDAVALLKHLGIGKVVVNGWSLGGAVAVDAAGLLGANCAAVVLTAGASPRYVQAADFPYGPPAGTATQTVAVLQQDRATFLDGLYKAVCAKPVSTAMQAWLWSIAMQTGPAADAALAELDQVEQRAALAALAVPLLSIVGGLDVVVAPEIGRQAGLCARHGTVVEFADCGHAPFLEDGPRYRQVLLDFLKTLP